MSIDKDKSRLEVIIAQASSLALCTYGNSGEVFMGMHKENQDRVLWLLHDLLHEANEIIEKGGHL